MSVSAEDEHLEWKQQRLEPEQQRVYKRKGIDDVQGNTLKSAGLRRRY